MSPALLRQRPVHYALPDVVLDDRPCVHEESPVLDGALLLDDGWLADRVADTARRWRHDDPRVAATLWWYSASATLTAPGAGALLRGVPAPDPRPARMTLRRNGHVGYLARTASAGTVAGEPVAYGAALVPAFAPVIGALARIGTANPRALWSVAADSLATRLLALGAGRATAELEAIAAGVVRGAGGALPTPRFAVAGGSRTFVRRGSCCLIFAVPGHGKCSNCPRQLPAARAARVLGDR